ncbi:site-specific integrase [Cereibacter johrii]|uniref:site-specific integrase n=1 Tax=Cereibacter johrii TaxID=445629 RepID=UPI000DCCA325|nr:site-specific integrase [Cereibacter johrii]RAZ83407.1 hypothetical protein DDV93_13930 [Cereibacter johrii]
MKTVDKIGRFTIAKNRGALYLRWWNPHLKKTESERLDATTVEDARRAAQARIRVVADPSETIDPESDGDPTFGEIWLAIEQEKRKTICKERFRLLENRRDLYYKAHLWSVRMSRMGPALRDFVKALEQGTTPPRKNSGRRGGPWKPKPLNPNTIEEIVGTAIEACALAKSDGVSKHDAPRKPTITGTTAPEDRTPKGRYISFEEMGLLIDACRRPHVLDLLLLDIGCGGRIGAVIDITGKKVRLDIGVIDLLGDGFVDTNRRKNKPIIPITGPMGRILERLINSYGDEALMRAGGLLLSDGARNWTQIIQRLIARAKKNRTKDQVARKLLEPKGGLNVNWYSIRRTMIDWLDERVSDASISAVMGHFEISQRTRRQLFEDGSPTTDLYKRMKLAPVFEVADVLEAEWWPSIQPFTSVDLRSDTARLMRTDAAE